MVIHPRSDRLNPSMPVIPIQAGDTCEYGLLQDDGSVLVSVPQQANDNNVFIFFSSLNRFLDFILRDQGTCSQGCHLPGKRGIPYGCWQQEDDGV
jgi:hypothetical protein